MSMAVFTTFETPRLRLRHFTDADLALFMAYRNDPEVARYQGWEGISEPEARVFLQDAKGEPTRCAWPLGFKSPLNSRKRGCLLAIVLLKIEEHDQRQAEIGYTLSRGYQGRGIASEAVSRVLEYAFVTLGMHRVIASDRCVRMSPLSPYFERLGLRREGHFRQDVVEGQVGGTSISMPYCKRNGRPCTARTYPCERMSIWSANPCTWSGPVACSPTFHPALSRDLAGAAPAVAGRMVFAPVYTRDGHLLLGALVREVT